jgi:hypothetical protein
MDMTKIASPHGVSKIRPTVINALSHISKTQSVLSAGSKESDATMH